MSGKIAVVRVARIALPTTVDEAVGALTETPGAQLLAGGTDFCVEVNFASRRPPAVVALRRVRELRRHEVRPECVVIGAGTTYADMGGPELSSVLPALAAAARTVGSPQIRNAGTIGGNVATASPAGDTLPLLAALDAQIVLRGPAGERSVPLGEVVTGVKRTSIGPDEVVVSVVLDRCTGPQQFLKVGTRNAMVIAIASAAVVVDLEEHEVRVALGSVAPVPIRASAAEAHIADAIEWSGPGGPRASEAALARFAELVGGAASPISDHRSTSEYRRRAVEVIARRALERCVVRAA
ncbi:MAG: FAD binding domain-containing protein [Acidimicrobiales bacterium]